MFLIYPLRGMSRPLTTPLSCAFVISLSFSFDLSLHSLILLLTFALPLGYEPELLINHRLQALLKIDCVSLRLYQPLTNALRAKSPPKTIKKNV